YSQSRQLLDIIASYADKAVNAPMEAALTAGNLTKDIIAGGVRGLANLAPIFAGPLGIGNNLIKEEDNPQFKDLFSSGNQDIGSTLARGIGEFLPYATFKAPTTIEQSILGAISGGANATEGNK